MGPLSADRVAATLAAARAVTPDVLVLTARIAEVAAPTGAEAERSAFVSNWLTENGFANPTVDDLGDVSVRLKGQKAGPPLLVAAHLDTVFSKETSLTVAHKPDRLHGPGIGDNSLGIAALLLLPRLLAMLEAQPAVDVLLAMPVGEEGLGNLRGMRAVVDANPDLGSAIALEGHNLGRVTHIAVGSRRLRVRVTGPGGHSWGAFGQPSAIHVLARIITQLDTIAVSTSPKTTFNVGMIDGGVSVNTIAPTASCVIDLRSTDPGSLAVLATEVEWIVRAANSDQIRTEIEILGDRPAGVVPLDSRIVGVATAALQALGIEAICDASSTDANVPISRGIPAVCLGLTSGGNAHREDEYIDVAPIPTGLAQLALVTLQLADDLAMGKRLTPAAA